VIPTLHIHLLGEFRLLWPDSTEAQAHSNLRTLVGRLSEALPYADSFLHVERTRLTTLRPFQIEP
jgi:DNA-binding SARP family transcriptional activator